MKYAEELRHKESNMNTKTWLKSPQFQRLQGYQKALDDVWKIIDSELANELFKKVSVADSFRIKKKIEELR